MNVVAESHENGSVSPEAQEVLNQLRNEGHVIEGDVVEAPDAPETPQDAPQSTETPEPSNVPLQKETEPTEQNTAPVDRAPREPALIPAWEHKVAEKRWIKENEELKAELARYKANPTQANQEAVTSQATNLKEMAKEYGLELDDAQEKFFSSLLQKAVPADAVKRLEAIEHERQIAFLEQQYNHEFENDVLPLLQDKYGQVSGNTLAELKAKLHDIAFTETYAKVPLKKVFIAEESELKLQRVEPQDTVKSTKSGKTRATVVDLDDVDEETFARMSPEDVEKYTKHQIDKSGGKHWR